MFGWRGLFFVGVVPVIFAFMVRRNLKESPEWLAAQKKNEMKKEKGKLMQLFHNPRTAFTTIALAIIVLYKLRAIMD